MAEPDPMLGVFRWSGRKFRGRLTGVVVGCVGLPVLAGVFGGALGGVVGALVAFVLAAALVFGFGVLLGFYEQRNALRERLAEERQEQDAAAGIDRIHVEPLVVSEPLFHHVGIRVCNDDNRTLHLYAQVTTIEQTNTLQRGSHHWLWGGPDATPMVIAPDSTAFLELGSCPEYERRDDGQWNAKWAFSDEPAEPLLYVKGQDTHDKFPDNIAFVTVRIWHQETDALAAHFRARLTVGEDIRHVYPGIDVTDLLPT